MSLDAHDTTEPRVHIAQSAAASGAVILTLTGEVDLSSVVTLRAAVDEALAAQPRELVFDLGGLKFMDSSGIAVLLAAAGRVEAVQVRNPTGIVRRVIELSGLTETLRMEPAAG